MTRSIEEQIAELNERGVSVANLFQRYVEGGWQCNLRWEGMNYQYGLGPTAAAALDAAWMKLPGNVAHAAKESAKRGAKPSSDDESDPFDD